MLNVHNNLKEVEHKVYLKVDGIGGFSVQDTGIQNQDGSVLRSDGECVFVGPCQRVGHVTEVSLVTVGGLDRHDWKRAKKL